jgi:hypothetical protein
MNTYGNILTLNGNYDPSVIKVILSGSSFAAFGNTYFVATANLLATKKIIDALTLKGLLFTFVHIEISTGSYVAGNGNIENMDSIRNIINSQYHYGID